MDTIFAREILASPTNTRGSKYDPDYTYILTTPVNVSRKRSKGFEVLVESVEGSAGETFVLMGLAPPPAPPKPVVRAVLHGQSKFISIPGWPAAKTESGSVEKSKLQAEAAKPTADSGSTVKPQPPVEPPKFVKKVEGLSKFMGIPEGKPVEVPREPKVPTVVVKPSEPKPRLESKPEPEPKATTKPKLVRKPSIFKHGRFKSGSDK